MVEGTIYLHTLEQQSRNARMHGTIGGVRVSLCQPASQSARVPEMKKQRRIGMRLKEDISVTSV